MDHLLRAMVPLPRKQLHVLDLLLVHGQTHSLSYKKEAVHCFDICVWCADAVDLRGHSLRDPVFDTRQLLHQDDSRQHDQQ